MLLVDGLKVEMKFLILTNALNVILRKFLVIMVIFVAAMSQVKVLWTNLDLVFALYFANRLQMDKID